MCRSAIVGRLACFVALTVVAFAGAATGYVTVGPASGNVAAAKIRICHATSSKAHPFVENSPNANGVLGGHAHHPDDIIPPFELVERGTTTIYPGKNMNARYGSGYTGVELLANGCRLPTGAVSVITVPESIIEPARTITVPGKTTTETIVETIVVPAATQTAPETTTVVTVPAQSETTVTFPERTVTLPPTTETVNEETVVRPAETVTLPGTIQTATAGTTSTVVTVTGPDKVVYEGTVATTQAVITVTAPRKITTEAAHTVDLPHKHKSNGSTVTETVPRSLTVPAARVTVPGTTTTKTLIVTIAIPASTATAPETTTVVTVNGGASVTKKAVVTVTTPSRVVHEQARVVYGEETKLIVLIVHATSCPPGTALHNGACHHIAHGKG